MQPAVPKRCQNRRRLFDKKNCFFIKTTYFEENLVNFFVLKIKVSNHFKRSNTLLRRTLQKYLVTTRTRLSAKKFYTKTNMRLLL